MPQITYLALDTDYDTIWQPINQLSDAVAVQQAVLTRLQLFQGEWWESLGIGLPVFQSMLGQLASQRGLNAMSLLIQDQILGTPLVVSVQDVQLSFTNGRLGFTALYTSTFGNTAVNGNINITVGPATAAILGV